MHAACALLFYCSCSHAHTSQYMFHHLAPSTNPQLCEETGDGVGEHTVRLVSETDGGVVEIPHTAAIIATSSVLAAACIDQNEEQGELALPASRASIALAAQWMTHKANGSDNAEAAGLLESARSEPSLFASLVATADFLAWIGRTSRPSPLLVRHYGHPVRDGGGSASAAHLAHEGPSNDE